MPLASDVASACRLAFRTAAQENRTINPPPTRYRIGDFAAKAGVTVRTVRYYDRLGLLPPSGRSESGQRLYSDDDFARLQQIVTLKLIGLTLDEIQRLLTDEPGEIAGLLERQKQALRAQAEQYLRLSDLIERAQAALGRSRRSDLHQFIEIIKAVTMHNQTEWLAQFLSDSQQQKLAETEANTPFARQRDHARAWQTLFADIRQQIDLDIHSPAAQALVDRWDALLAPLTQGDAAAEAGINQAYAAYDTLPSLADAPPEIRAWALSLREAAAFIEQARAARKESTE